MKKATTALLPLCIGALLLTAAEVKPPPPPSDADRIKASTDQFMVLLSKGQTTEAFIGLLRSTWFKPFEAGAQANDLDSQYQETIKTLEPDLGTRMPGAYEFLGRRRVGNSLVTLVYVEKYQYTVWPWALTFYKAQDEWRLRAVAYGQSAWDDMMALSVSEPASEAAKDAARDTAGPPRSQGAPPPGPPPRR